MALYDGLYCFSTSVEEQEKNGYLGFEDFCLLTPTNGIKHYNIDIFATTEDQAKTTFNDVYNVLEDNRDKMQRFFYWNTEKKS